MQLLILPSGESGRADHVALLYHAFTPPSLSFRWFLQCRWTDGKRGIWQRLRQARGSNSVLAQRLLKSCFTSFFSTQILDVLDMKASTALTSNAGFQVIVRFTYAAQERLTSWIPWSKCLSIKVGDGGFQVVFIFEIDESAIRPGDQEDRGNPKPTCRGRRLGTIPV